ncbi:O-antigen ligase family protein [Fischerella sp. PCC 9605]|uniref:O-antigen ligase family protein n=1 Tax=Fischerella sp. PCC 9605 TaxID=1173024 RepID=UPI00047EE61E|nr:O-antigen ligase family protein [Fischerella sp. PCC 9605]
MENRNIVKQFMLEKALDGLGLACLSLLILQVSINFLPYFVVLKYMTTTRLILLLGFICLILLHVVKKQQPNWNSAIRGSKILLVLITLLLAWYGVSLFNGSAISFSSFRLQVEEVLAFLFVILRVDGEEKFNAVVFVFLVAVSVIALHSIKQFIEYDNTHYFLIWRGAWTVTESLEIPKGAIVRVVGYFNNPNVLATYLILLIPIVASLIKHPHAPTWMIGLLVALASVALLLTFSRSSIIALLLALGVTLTRKKPFVFIFFAILVAATLLNPLSIGRLATGYARFSAWSIAIEMILQKPLFGVGLGNFRTYAVNFWHAHNLFLHIAAEAGLIAGTLLLTIVLVAIKQALELSRCGGRTRLIGQAFTVAFIAFGIASLMDNAYNTTAVSYTFWLLLGLLVAARRIFENRRHQTVRYGFETN